MHPHIWYGTHSTVQYSTGPPHQRTKSRKLSQAAMHSSAADTFARNSASSTPGPLVQRKGRLCSNILSRRSKRGSVGSPNTPHIAVGGKSGEASGWVVACCRKACPCHGPSSCVPGTSLEGNPSGGSQSGPRCVGSLQTNRRGRWQAPKDHGRRVQAATWHKKPTGRRRGGAERQHGSLRAPKRPTGAQGKHIYALHK